MTAQAILSWRDEHGGFTAVDELLEVDGIGDATLAQLAPLRHGVTCGADASTTAATGPRPADARCWPRAAWAGALAGRWAGLVGAGARRRARARGRRGWRRRRDGRRRARPPVRLLVLAAVAAVTTLRADQVERSPVARLAAERAAVQRASAR